MTPAAWLTVREAELLRGDWLDPNLAKILLDDCGSRGIREHRLSPRTRDLYEGIFRLDIRPFLGNKEMGAIKADHVGA